MKQKKADWTPEMEQRFKSVFRSYPNHTAGNEARAEFAKINPDDELLETMKAAIEWQAPIFLRRGKIRLIPHFRRWLHNRWWQEDELDEYKRPSKNDKKEQDGCARCGFNSTLHWMKKNQQGPQWVLEHPKICGEFTKA